MNDEPKIKAALIQNVTEAAFRLVGAYRFDDGRAITGPLTARVGGDTISLHDETGRVAARGDALTLWPADPTHDFFTLENVRIGIDFHWDRLQILSYRGALILQLNPDRTMTLVNWIGLDDYLASVISSEMSSEAPLEFLKAQAITARSWLLAMLEKKQAPRPPQIKNDDDVTVWQDVNDHQGFDVCADDHCQRYQGITHIISDHVALAVSSTRGELLLHEGRICDARYHKCCGGRTEEFQTAWENVSYPYLTSLSDSKAPHPPVVSEEDAALWFHAHPDAYCNTTDRETLRRLLPTYDLETLHFFRWRVAYEKEELQDILLQKSGIDFGEVRHLLPVSRGPSGRISKLKIIGSKKTVTVGKELEIRRWLSRTHLLSSAFVTAVEHDSRGHIKRFVLHGGGWGHGVGLCQIGAAVMAVKGSKAQNILAHYFPGTSIQKLY
jgi:SpoIID/LytB domain protein